MIFPCNEEGVYPAVESGELVVDDEGKVWRTAVRRWNRRTGQAESCPCEPYRAERISNGYYQVRVMFDKRRHAAAAHRLVWRVLHGPIPDGLTINHKNGKRLDNNPHNLELATYAEQVFHARNILRRGKLNQWGPNNSFVKLSTDQVRAICSRRADGVSAAALAREFGVNIRHVRRIVSGERRQYG